MSDADTQTRQAQVVHVIQDNYEPFRITINRGAKDGIKLGDKFLVFGFGPNISDPETGEELGRIEIVRGRGTVTHVQDRLATLTSTERRVRVKRPPNWMAGIVTIPLEERVQEDVPFLAVEVGDMAKPL